MGCGHKGLVWQISRLTSQVSGGCGANRAVNFPEGLLVSQHVNSFHQLH